MYTFNIFLIFALSTFTKSQAQDVSLSETEFSPIPPYMGMLFLITTLLLVTIVRIVVLKYNIPTPFSAFIALCGFAWGIFGYYVPGIRDISGVIYLSPHDTLYLYSPVLIFSIAFSVDSAILMKILPQVVVIGFPGVVFGYLMRLIIGASWSIRGGFLFGIFCSPVYPMAVVYLLKKHSQTRQTSVILEAEALIGLIIAEIAHTLIVNTIAGYVAHWYQYVMISLRFLVLGCLAGYLLGLFGRYLLRTTYTNRLSVSIFTFSLPFATYALSTKYISGCGSISVAVIGLMMSVERTALSKELDVFLDDFWTTISIVFDNILCFNYSVIFAMDVAPLFEWSGYILVVITFVVYYVVRFVSFLVFSPLISRLGYGMDLKNLIVCVWGGIKCPFSVLLVRVFIDYQLKKERNSIWYFYIMGLYVLSMFINGTFTRTILDFLSLRTISLARQINMNNCIKHIFTKRERTIAILKMDRFLADADWPLVIQATNMKHPYHLEFQNDEIFFYGRPTSANCPDCNKEIEQEPTARELKEMIREANLRILKAKKMSYSRQFANGMMSKETIRILTQAVDFAADSDNAIIELEGLQKRFTQDDCITRCIRNRVHQLSKPKGTSIRPPRGSFRRFCYSVVVNKIWERGMYCVIGLNVVWFLLVVIYRGSVDDYASLPSSVRHLDFSSQVIFCGVYVFEFVMKILAYSWLHIWKHGVRTYFRSVWNIIDFIVIVGYVCTLAKNLQRETPLIVDPNTSPSVFVVSVMLWMRVLRFLRLFEMFYPKVIRYLDRDLDSKIASTYELGKSYTVGETEVLDLLPYMIDNKKIREEIKQTVERDRVIITKLLGIVQKEKPWVAITVKTKQAIRTILNSMQEAKAQLKISGWVDDYEQEKLEYEMSRLYKKVNAIQNVQPSAPKVIFKEVAWMAEEKEMIDFLFENVTVKTYEPGDVAFCEGTVADGIYIVVTGLFMITYQPNKSVLESLHEYGKLPIVDYLSSTKFEESSLDYIVSGNCIGECSTLTRRAYNCTITADAHSQVYVLSYNILKRAMELSPDPVTGLECRIWKEVSIRIAVPLLLSVPAYQNYSQDQIKYTLERAFVPNLACYKVLTVTEMIQDIILIEGVVADFNTRDMFVAPCCIPRRVQKLILPNSSLMNIPIDLETKLLIIPEKDLDEYDVMEMAEETGELVAIGSSGKCLQHMVQDKARQRRKIKIAVSTGHGKHRKRVQSMSPTTFDSVLPRSPSGSSYEQEKKKKSMIGKIFSESRV